MKEKENKISETEQEEIKNDSGTDEETKDEKETEPYMGIRGDVLVSPDKLKYFLFIAIPCLVIALIFSLTEMW